MSKAFVKCPSDVVSAGDVVDCYVIEVLEKILSWVIPPSKHEKSP